MTTANGMFYDVYRELDSNKGFTLIGSSATRFFDDTTITAGTPEAKYSCTARRGTLIGDTSVQMAIRLGMAA